MGGGCNLAHLHRRCSQLLIQFGQLLELQLRLETLCLGGHQQQSVGDFYVRDSTGNGPIFLMSLSSIAARTIASGKAADDRTTPTDAEIARALNAWELSHSIKMAGRTIRDAKAKAKS